MHVLHLKLNIKSNKQTNKVGWLRVAYKPTADEKTVYQIKRRSHQQPSMNYCL